MAKPNSGSIVYNKQYFIKKFEATKEDEWCKRTLINVLGQKCVLGMCGTTVINYTYIFNDESVELAKLLGFIEPFQLAIINDLVGSPRQAILDRLYALP